MLGLQASGAVNLNGFNPNANGSGFRGGGQTFATPYGPPVIDPVNRSTFYRAVAGGLPGGEREGSFKGEGIAGTLRLVYNGAAQVDALVDGITGGSRGRGAPGNAGGGVSCDLGAWGGNGGGIVIGRAASLSYTGSLTSNGNNGLGPNTGGSCTDAAGGAGAGGTLYPAIGAGLGGRALHSTGGAGGTSSYSEHGPGGGGGGGGAVYYNSSAGLPSISASGGANGVDTPTIAPISAWFATSGTASVITSSVVAATTTCSTQLEVQKTNGTTTVAAGSTTSHTVTFTNSGATAADGSTVKEVPSAGLSCTVTACTPSSLPIAAACPAAAQWPNLLTAGGVLLGTFPAEATITFSVSCGVVTTGQ